LVVAEIAAAARHSYSKFMYSCIYCLASRSEHVLHCFHR